MSQTELPEWLVRASNELFFEHAGGTIPLPLLCDVRRKPSEIVAIRRIVAAKLRARYVQHKTTRLIVSREDVANPLPSSFIPLSYPVIGKLLNMHHTSVMLMLRRATAEPQEERVAEAKEALVTDHHDHCGPRSK